MKKSSIVISAFLLMLAMLVLTGCQDTSKYNETVVATVTDLDYEEGSTMLIPYYSPATKTTQMITKVEKPKYYVTVEYESLSKTFTSEKLYKSVNVGDKIEVDLVSVYNSDDILVQQYLN